MLNIVKVDVLIMLLLHQAVDPQCTAYKMIFGEVSKRMNKEFAKSAFGMGAPAPRKEGEPFSIMDLAMKP